MNEKNEYIAYWIVIKVTECVVSQHLRIDYLSSPAPLSHSDNWYLSPTDDKVQCFKSQIAAKRGRNYYGEDRMFVVGVINKVDNEEQTH